MDRAVQFYKDKGFEISYEYNINPDIMQGVEPTRLYRNTMAYDPDGGTVAAIEIVEIASFHKGFGVHASKVSGWLTEHMGEIDG